MKIGVIGVGVVGGAVLRAFQQSHEVIGYDLSSEYFKNWDEITKCFLVFLCLPSPTVDGVQDISAIESTISRLVAAQYRGVVCIKSTVLPGTCERLKKSGLRICHNPEFLTAAKPFEDFMAQESIIIGGDYDDYSTVQRAYAAILPNVPCLRFPSCSITEIAKYMRNTYLATKISFANEYYSLCKHAGVEYNDVKYAMLSQGGIEKGHWNVPGPDGKRGYSGMCFPKDTRAMSGYLKKNNLDNFVISATEACNQRIRPHGPHCEEVTK